MRRMQYGSGNDPAHLDHPSVVRLPSNKHRLSLKLKRAMLRLLAAFQHVEKPGRIVTFTWAVVGEIEAFNGNDKVYSLGGVCTVAKARAWSRSCCQPSSFLGCSVAFSCAGACPCRSQRQFPTQRLEWTTCATSFPPFALCGSRRQAQSASQPVGMPIGFRSIHMTPPPQPVVAV